MLLLSDIEAFIIETLKSSNDFKEKSLELLGKEFTFESPEKKIRTFIDYLPLITTVPWSSTIESKDECFYRIRVIFIAYGKIKEDNTFFYPINKALEEITVYALKLIEERLRDIGINGDCNIYINQSYMELSELQEAEDVQSVVTMELSKNNFI